MTMARQSGKTGDVFLPHIDLGHQHVETFLDRCLEGEIPPMLFTGPEGTGKEYTAIDFARKLFCSQRPRCRLDGDLCASCLSAARLENPGIYFAYPTPTQGKSEGEEDDLADISKVLDAKREDIFSTFQFSKKVSLRIAKSRAIVKRAYMKPFDGRYNVFIIMDAHTMREEAQNSLLKLIEEPPPQCVLILVTPQSEALLYTVRSRCQQLRFPLLKASVVEKLLRTYYGVEEAAARQAAALSRGSIKDARALASSYDDTGKKEALDLVRKLQEAPEAWLIGKALGMSRGANRDKVALFLHELELYFRDIMAAEESLYFNVDSITEINALRQGWRRKNLPMVLDKISDARDKIIRRNMNVDATLAHLFLDIKRSR
jgi:DNA polymerase-3 subunit delta'